MFADQVIDWFSSFLNKHILGGKFREGEAQVILQTDQSEFVVCTLIFGSVLQQNLNMKIMAGEKVTLYSEGKGEKKVTDYRWPRKIYDQSVDFIELSIVYIQSITGLAHLFS